MSMTATTGRDAGESGRLVRPLRESARYGVTLAGSQTRDSAKLLVTVGRTAGLGKTLSWGASHVGGQP